MRCKRGCDSTKQPGGGFPLRHPPMRGRPQFEDKVMDAKTGSNLKSGELKVGAKVTIGYAMTAKTIEAKPDKAK